MAFPGRRVIDDGLGRSSYSRRNRLSMLEPAPSEPAALIAFVMIHAMDFRGAEGGAMLTDERWRYRMTEDDLRMFRQLVRDDHPLRLALERIPWESFRATLEAYYHEKLGQPAIDPVRMLKLEFLRYQYNLSDRQVIEHCETDLSFRYFLQVGCNFRLPDASLLTRFRGRLGAEGFQKIFQQLVALARAAGLVKDRLRLKDASHVIADIAIPTALQLVAQARDQLLAAAEPWDAEAVAGHHINSQLLRERTKNLPDDQRLAARVTHLQEILAWAEQIAAPPALDEADAVTQRAWQRLVWVRDVTRKILFDQAHPDAGRRTLSVFDPEARRGKHGEWYEGYIVDILMDADSELITEVNTLQAGGDEAKDAVELVAREQATHGNQIEAFSIDGAGFNGEMLRAIEDPEQGLGITTYVPPKTEPTHGRFTPADFTKSEDDSHVTCPAGQPSRYRQRDSDDHGYLYRFTRAQCDGCPLAQQCVAKPGQGAFGRTVQKSDYEAEYRRARERATTAAYAAVRSEHAAVERKLNEVLNHHDGRHARYWGRAKVHAQECMTCFTVNVKRMVKLLTSTSESACAPAVG